MKRLTILFMAAALGVVAVGATVLAAETTQWFDMKNCGMCKHMMEDPALLQNSTWEHHNISNGIVSVSTVKDDAMPAYKKAMAGFQATSAKLQKGEQVQLCGMCTAMGSLFPKGARYESIPTEHGSVSLITGDSPELIADIQAWGERTTKDLAKLDAALSAE